MAITPEVISDRPAALPPGPRLPVAVQTFLLTQRRQVAFPALRRRYGDVFTLQVAPGNRTIVLLSRPEDIRTVFTGSTSVFHAGEGNAILGPVMGEHSVLLTDEDAHRRVRTLLMPAFHGAALRGYQDLITRLAVQEAERWPTGLAFRASDRMAAVTLEIILQVVFGVTDPTRLDKLRPLVRGVADTGVVIMLSWFFPFLDRFGPWRRAAAGLAELDRLIYAEIDDRRGTPDLADRTDVLSRLLSTTDEQGDRLTDAELRDQLITLLLAGHETTATALSWALHELTRRPEQLHAAQRAADNGDDEYLTAVVKETMRLRPVIYQVSRKLTEPTEVAGYLLPEGTTVMPCIGLVQEDPENHPQPEEFRPQRFLDGQPPANTWIPFGGGARRCLGAGFSLLEATIVLREVLRRHDVAPDRPEPEGQHVRHITLVPAKGARIVVTARAADTPGDSR
jgi:cytochrome P450